MIGRTCKGHYPFSRPHHSRHLQLVNYVMTSETDPAKNDYPGSAIHSDGSPNIAEKPPTTSSLLGWHEYPLNLPIYNGFSQNMSLHSSRLTAEAGRLFCASNKATIEVWDISQPSDTNRLCPISIKVFHELTLISDTEVSPGGYAGKDVDG